MKNEGRRDSTRADTAFTVSERVIGRKREIPHPNWIPHEVLNLDGPTQKRGCRTAGSLPGRDGDLISDLLAVGEPDRIGEFIRVLAWMTNI